MIYVLFMKYEDMLKYVFVVIESCGYWSLFVEMLSFKVYGESVSVDGEVVFKLYFDMIFVFD